MRLMLLFHAFSLDFAGKQSKKKNFPRASISKPISSKTYFSGSIIFHFRFQYGWQLDGKEKKYLN